MAYIFDRYSNTVNQLKKAVQFNQFSFKLLQIRLAEEWMKRVAPSRFYTVPPLPRDIVIRVTEQCFLKCKFCAQGGERGRVDRNNLATGPVQMDTFRKIIEEASRWRIKPFIKITGGEPLLMGLPFLDILKEMRAKQFVVKVNTNGMLLKNKEIARGLAEADINYLSISLDGGRAVHDALRGSQGLFDAIMEGIDNVQEYRRKSGSRNMMILISMMVSNETQSQIEEVYRIAVEKNIDWFNIQFLNYTTPDTCSQAYRYFHNRFGTTGNPWDAFCNPRFNQIDAHSVARQIRAILGKRQPIPVSVLGDMSLSSQIARYYFTLDPIRENICVIPFTGMHIVPPGKAVFCIDYPFYEYGDIRTQTLQQVWYSKRATDFRNDMIAYHKKHGKNFPQCQRCNWRFN